MLVSVKQGKSILKTNYGFCLNYVIKYIQYIYNKIFNLNNRVVFQGH